ncbi:hypothetical protein [Bordetella sp. N]|uniref:hypothetical protein n=1 Tax=Bordetella sp. N TaxID=1746199 RepID=UPI0012E33026|nr:hypothetical protein [Bordetella sp. N]
MKPKAKPMPSLFSLPQIWHGLCFALSMFLSSMIDIYCRQFIELMQQKISATGGRTMETACPARSKRRNARTKVAQKMGENDA